MSFPSTSLPHGPKVETKKALLLIDLQNDFVSSAGRLRVVNTADFIYKVPSLTAKFREAGQVIWIQSTFRQPCPTVSPQTGCYSVFLRSMIKRSLQDTTTDVPRNHGCVPDGSESVQTNHIPLIADGDSEAFLSARTLPTYERCCLPNSVGANLPDHLASSVDKQKDLVFHKSQYSALADFNVVMQIRARMINDLYICGSLSNIGVYATVLDAVQQGFNVTLIEDWLGFRDEACHIEAMTRMADDFGASGTDYQELMDDLHGLLGDVIPASKYTRKFQLSMQLSQGAARKPLSRSQKVNQWMDTIESDSEAEKPSVATGPERGQSAPRASSNILADVTTVPPRESSPPLPPAAAERSRASPTYSPPCKRSTSSRDDVEEPTPPSSVPAPQPVQQSSTKKSISEKPVSKKTKTEAVTKEASTNLLRASVPEQQSSPPKLSGPSLSTSHIEIAPKASTNGQLGGRAMSQPDPMPTNSLPQEVPKIKKHKYKFDATYLGPHDSIGDGNAKVIHNVLPAPAADQAFVKLKNGVAWQKMYHRTGEVPRLVAVQGKVSSDGAIPIYRHPADQSPPLCPFSDDVDQLRQSCERLVGHELNHVLIQYYRNGEDNISEHSDKTLDVVRGSSIVNLSIGAMRTMTLRAKKISQPVGIDTTAVAETTDGAPRASQRIRLPHNSLFVLDERTNANWLHSVRADKRPVCEKSEEELAYDGERISLTFRNIGTFIDVHNGIIWGQGATGKNRDEAKKILLDREAEQAGERMIVGFGKENHLNDTYFKWSEVYGSGFDVVNFEVKASDG